MYFIYIVILEFDKYSLYAESSKQNSKQFA